MGFTAFFGYLILGTGPGIVVYGLLLAPKAFLVLVTLASAFLWLMVLLVISSIFRGFDPISVNQGSYAGVLVASVAIQEAFRYGLWLMHKKLVGALREYGLQLHQTLDNLDELHLATAWGFGHGACHAVFFFVSMLPLTLDDGTYFSPTCSAYNIFLAGAMNALAFVAIHTSSMVVYIDACKRGNYIQFAYAPLMHLTAALLTLANFNDGGCKGVIPVLLALGCLSILYATQVVWRAGRDITGSASLTERISDRMGSEGLPLEPSHNMRT